MRKPLPFRHEAYEAHQAPFKIEVWEAIKKQVGERDHAFSVDGLIGVLPPIKGLLYSVQKRMIEETLAAALAQGRTTLIRHDKKTWQLPPAK